MNRLLVILLAILVILVFLQFNSCRCRVEYFSVGGNIDEHFNDIVKKIKNMDNKVDLKQMMNKLQDHPFTEYPEKERIKKIKEHLKIEGFSVGGRISGAGFAGSIVLLALLLGHIEILQYVICTDICTGDYQLDPDVAKTCKILDDYTQEELLIILEPVNMNCSGISPPPQ